MVHNCSDGVHRYGEGRIMVVSSDNSREFCWRTLRLFLENSTSAQAGPIQAQQSYAKRLNR